MKKSELKAFIREVIEEVYSDASKLNVSKKYAEQTRKQSEKDDIKDAGKKTCTVCHGKGKTWTMCGDVDVDTTCNNCGGAGEV